MSDRVNPSQKIEAAELLQRQNMIAAQMVGFSLEQLEAATNGLVSQSRVENMTVTDLNELKRLDQSLTLQLASDAAIDAYTLVQMKADTMFMAEFYTEPLRSEFLNLANSMTSVEFVESKKQMKVFAAQQRTAAANTASGVLETARLEGFSLEFKQAQMLRNVPNIGALVEEVRVVAQTQPNPEAFLASPEAKELLIDKVTEKAFRELSELFENNYSMLNQIQVQQQQETFNAEIQEKLGTRVEGVLGGNNVGEHLGNLGRLGFGMGGFKDINSNPLLVAVMSPQDRAKFNQDFIKAIESDGLTPPNIRGLFYESIKANVTSILEGTSVDKIDNHFRSLHVTDGESGIDAARIKEDKAIMVKKLKTVPDHWRDTKEAEKYEEYVLENGPDSYDFMAALDRGYLGEISWIRKIGMMIRGWIEMGKEMLGFNGDEDEDGNEKWDRIEHYKADATDAPGTTTNSPSSPDAQKANAILEPLKTRVEQAHGPNSFNIVRNGEPFVPSSAEDLAKVEKIISTFGSLPKYTRLFTLGIELDDLYFLADKGKDQLGQDDNVHFDVSDTGVSFSFDMGSYFKGHVEEALGGLAGLGIAAKILGGIGALVSIKGIALGAVLAAVGGGIAYGVGAIDNPFSQSFDYDDFSPERFHAALEEIKADINLITEAFAGITPETIGPYIKDFETHKARFDFTNIQSFPPEMFSADGISPAFQKLLSLPDSFWGAKTLTGDDLATFASFMDENAWWGRIDNSEDEFEVKGNVFEVHGSTLFWDKDFASVEDFFTWLRS